MSPVRSISGLFLLAVAAGCVAPLVEQAAAQKLEPLPVGAASRSITLDRVIIDIPKGTVVGETSVGFDCLSPDPRKWTSNTLDFRDGDFHIVFDALARESGFRLREKRSSVFEEAETRADLLVGGKVESVKQNDCVNFTFQAEHKGSVRYIVRWEIYAPAERKLLLVVETEGSGVLDEFRRDGVMEYYLRAFGGALKGLLGNPDFRKIVTAPAEAAK